MSRSHIDEHERSQNGFPFDHKMYFRMDRYFSQCAVDCNAQIELWCGEDIVSRLCVTTTYKQGTVGVRGPNICEGRTERTITSDYSRSRCHE